MNKTVYVVVGPTAVGKSDYAVQLAKKINGEIISADSRQVYVGLDIGSGKITKDEMQGIPHFMLDAANPKKVFSAWDFAVLAGKNIEDIFSRKKTPIVVGGTGFYIDALVGENILPEVKADPELRKELSHFSKEQMFEKLKSLDPEFAKTIDSNNPVRLIRAIEIATTLGNIPQLQKRNLPFEVKWIGLNMSREKLKENINKRLQKRIENGMLEEVENLHKEKLSWNRLYELGLEYRYCAMFLQGKISKEEMIETLQNKIYQYAMRQLTWFKRNEKIEWIDL